jgi:hypothetical protein
MNSFTPGDIIYKKDTTLFLLVLAVKPPVPSSALGGAFITVLPLGENKPLGPLFITPTHWLSLLDPNR